MTYPQNQKHITYRNTARAGPSHSHSQSTCTENLMKFGCVVFEICERANRHTHHNTVYRATATEHMSPQKCYACGEMWTHSKRGSSGPHESTLQMAFRSVQPLLHNSSVCKACRQADTYRVVQKNGPPNLFL